MINTQTWLEKFYELNSDVISVTETKKLKEYKNDLFKDIIPALDRRDVLYYNRLSDEQKKEISIWTLTRWMSSTSKNASEQLFIVNKVVNMSSKFLNKHKELQWMLLALTGSGVPVHHPWIAPPRGIKKNRLEEEILTHYPHLKDDELELLLNLNSKENLEAFFKDNGYDEKTINDLLKL